MCILEGRVKEDMKIDHYMKKCPALSSNFIFLIVEAPHLITIHSISLLHADRSLHDTDSPPSNVKPSPNKLSVM